MRLLFALTILLTAQASGAERPESVLLPTAWDTYLNATGGYTAVTANEKEELNKKGYTVSFTLGIQRRWGILSSSAGIGYRAISLVNDGTSKSKTQESITSTAASADLGVGINVKPWLKTSLAGRMIIGPNSVIDTDLDKERTFYTSLTPKIEFPIETKYETWLPGLFYEKSVGLKGRSIATLGVSLSVDLPWRRKPTPPPLIDQVTVPLVSINLASTELNVRSITRLKRAANFLKHNQRLWDHVEIRVHTNSVGDAEKALQLSQAKAEAILQVLYDEGLDARFMSAVGLGDADPVLGSDPRDAVNRRVEFMFKGVRDESSLRNGLQKLDF